jgi:hypothetical protein
MRPVQTRNHALRTLWPVLSTDILTPFIDLLEDAMLGQVPPVVVSVNAALDMLLWNSSTCCPRLTVVPQSSVRLSSPSLGSEPFILNSMRIMTDEEVRIVRRVLLVERPTDLFSRTVVRTPLNGTFSTHNQDERYDQHILA